MAWGLPPKYEMVHQFTNKPIETINQSVKNALINFDFEIFSESMYQIRSRKKMRMTFFSFFSFSRPYITLDIYMTKSGRVTLKSKYDYGSMFGIAMNDKGRQHKELTVLMIEIKEITALNHKHNPFVKTDENANYESKTIVKDIDTTYTR